MRQRVKEDKHNFCTKMENESLFETTWSINLKIRRLKFYRPNQRNSVS